MIARISDGEASTTSVTDGTRPRALLEARGANALASPGTLQGVSVTRVLFVAGLNLAAGPARSR
jgi:hypothetical protein